MNIARLARTLWLAAKVTTVVVVVVLLAVAISGYILFTRAPQDAPERVDAIVVLGGEHDGREEYGLALARQGFADTVVMSDPYWAGDPYMRGFCRSPQHGIEVICRAPDPSTTRGEALLARDLAQQRGWTRIIVVSWQFHLPRARYIFAQCFSGSGRSALYRAVPRTYDYSPLRWEFTYLYQYGGFAKAVAEGDCH